MDLLKAFDCIYDLLMVKLHANGFDENFLVFLLFSYLKPRKQSARVNNTYSSFQTILSGVSQGFVLGSQDGLKKFLALKEGKILSQSFVCLNFFLPTCMVFLIS